MLETLIDGYCRLISYLIAALLAAVGLFVVGAAVSIWHGISELLHEPGGPENYTIAYVVLGIALVLEGIDLRHATRRPRWEPSPKWKSVA